MPLQACPIPQPRQVHVVELCVVVELAAVKFPPAHQDRPGVAETDPILEELDGLVKHGGILDVVLHDAGELGAKRADFGVKLGANERTEVVDDFQLFVDFDRADFDDFHLSRLPASPAGGLQIVHDELTFAHLLREDSTPPRRTSPM